MDREIAKQSVGPVYYKGIQEAFRNGNTTTGMVHNFSVCVGDIMQQITK